MTLTIDSVWRDWNTQGVPTSGDHKPVKSDIRRVLKSIAGGTAAVGDFRGAWSSSTAYISSDLIEYGGSIWYALANSTNVTPTEGASWTLFLPGVTVADGAITNSKVSSSAGIAATKLSYQNPSSGALARTVQRRLEDRVSVFDFMTTAQRASVLAGDAEEDVTAAINAAVASGKSVYMADGVARVDGTITIPVNCSLELGPHARLKRFSSKTEATVPVLHVKGNWARYRGGSIESQNESPQGVVALGHLNQNASDWNSLFWRFEDCDVHCKDFGGAAADPFPGATSGVGLYIPSSQPYLGNGTVNYFGMVANVTIYNGTRNVYLTDLANSHTFINVRSEFYYHNAFVLAGAYGNTFYGTFLNGSYVDETEAIYLTTKNYPAAPYASSLQSNYNNFFGMASELYMSDCVTLKIDANCQNNFFQISHNSGGSTYWTDLDGANTVMEPHKTRIHANSQIEFSTNSVVPSTNGGVELGGSGRRWYTVYLANEPVVSSDGDIKQDIGPLSEDELAVARKIPGLVRRYRLIVDVASQGDAAKWQIGLVAQDLITAFAEEGLNVAHYGLFNAPDDGHLGLRYGQVSMFALAAIG